MSENPNAPTMPSALVGQMLDGLHPLCAWRQAVGLTQAQLATKSGVRPATISGIETRQIDPRVSTMIALARTIGVDPGDLIDGARE